MERYREIERREHSHMRATVEILVEGVSVFLILAFAIMVAALVTTDPIKEAKAARVVATELRR
jgi:hypothetical protein